MKRKVAQIGPATLMVSLPSKWVKRNKVKKGQEVDVIEDNTKLTVSVDTPDFVERASIKVTTPPDADIGPGPTLESAILRLSYFPNSFSYLFSLISFFSAKKSPIASINI